MEGERAEIEVPSRPIWWIALQDRASELEEGEQARLVMRLLSHTDEGWTTVIELAAIPDACPSPPDPTRGDEVVNGLMAFLRLDVVELFTSLARLASMLVPNLRVTNLERADPDEIDRVGERFSRNLLVLHLAASDPILPQVIRESLRRVSRELLEWYPDFSVLAAAAARLAEPGHLTGHPS